MAPRPKWTRRSAVGAALGLALVALTPASAAVADEYDPVVTYDSSSATVEYGEYWSFTAKATNTDTSMGAIVTVTMSGVPSGYTPTVGSAPNHGGMGNPYETIYVSPNWSAAFLAAGTYTVEASTSWGDRTSPKATATLTVTPAKLGMEVRVLADPTNSTGAIVTAKLTGRFVDEYFPSTGDSPAGSWRIVLKDSTGETALDTTVDHAADDTVLATSFYWFDAEPGEQYTATAEFTPSGTSASNFAITAAPSFSYTAPAEVRPAPTSSATAQPDPSLPEATGFSVPLWALILAIALILGLAALVTVLSVHLSRNLSTAAKEVSA